MDARRSKRRSACLVLAGLLIGIALMLVILRDPDTPRAPQPSVCEYPPVARASVALRLVIATDSSAPAIPLEIPVGSRTLSLAGIFRQAGVELSIEKSTFTLPNRSQWSDGQMQEAVTQVKKAMRTGGNGIPVVVLVIPYYIDSNNAIQRGVLGKLVDARTRNAVAVYYRPSRGNAETPRELFRSLAHELTHVLNLRHGDWEGAGFKTRSTLEGYSTAADAHWCLSRDAADYFQDTAIDSVFYVPGDSGVEYGIVGQKHAKNLQDTPSDTFEVMPDTRGEQLPQTRAFVTVGPSNVVTDDYPLKLRLSASRSRILLREPFEMQVELINAGPDTLPVVPLDFDRQQLRIDVTAPDRTVTRMRPATANDSRDDVRLGPRGVLRTVVRPAYGIQPELFDRPGTYVLQAQFPVALNGPENSVVRSEPLEIDLVTPIDRASVSLAAEIDRAFAGSRWSELARFMSGSGNVGNDTLASELEALLASHKDAALAQSFWMLLAQGHLQAARKAETTSEKMLQLGKAERLQQQALASGADAAAALGEQIEQQRNPLAGQFRLQFARSSSVIAVDALDTLKSAAADAAIRRGRILVIGHADQHGSATLNRFLSCQRALAVRTALRLLDVPLENLVVLGAGSADPVDRSRTPRADDRNRRVEIVTIEDGSAPWAACG